LITRVIMGHVSGRPVGAIGTIRTHETMNMQSSLPEYEYTGARAMVLLHEHYLREFVATWKLAKAAGVVLPATTDPSYVSLEAVLAHVCRAARGYMTWMCEVLELPDPGIRPAPTADTVEADVDEFVEHLLERWRAPLASVPEDRFEHPEFESRWKTKYCIDAMLEHAVMHPLRHEFQLAQLMAAAGAR
jgi:uncharacterized damage-inducible protein DinB